MEPSMTALAERMEEKIDEIRALIVACKAQGGYKWRQMIRGTDAEIDQLVAKCVPKMYEIGIRLAIAEDLLRNSSMSDRTIEEYEDRVMVAVDGVNQAAAAQGQTLRIDMRGGVKLGSARV